MSLGVGVVGMPAAAAVVLYRTAAVALGRTAATRITVVAGVAWTVAVAGVAGLAATGAFDPTPGRFAPWLILVALVPLTAILVAARAPRVWPILTGPRAMGRLVVPQTFRVVGAVFLIVMLLGELPAVFAVPAGLGDIAVGLAAPAVAARLRQGRRDGAVWFHVVGLLDFVVAFALAILAGLGPSNVLGASPSTGAMSQLPLVLVPTTVVPLAVALHIIGLRQLAAAGRPIA
jgi:hypothetical protein